MDQLIPGADRDIVTPLHKRIDKRYAEDPPQDEGRRKSRPETDGLTATFEGRDAPEADMFDKILVAVGRKPNGRPIGAEKAGVAVDERGFIPVDKQMRTNVPHIFAIGDIVGQPMLAHKATHEGKVAAEVAAGQQELHSTPRSIPSVAYTDPEVAWVGLTENEAKAKGIKYGKGVFPWAASGRSLSARPRRGLDQGALRRGDAIAIIGARHRRAERGRSDRRGRARHRDGRRCCRYRRSPSIRIRRCPRPIGMAAEAFEGTITDLYMPRRRRIEHLEGWGKEFKAAAEIVTADDGVGRSIASRQDGPPPVERGLQSPLTRPLPAFAVRAPPSPARGEGKSVRR